MEFSVCMHSTTVNAGSSRGVEQRTLSSECDIAIRVSDSLERVRLLQTYTKCMQSTCGRITTPPSANCVAFRRHSSGQLAYSLVCGQVAIDQAMGGELRKREFQVH